MRRLTAALRESCDRIDVLANNAGGLFSGPSQTTDGFEKTFQVNHLAPYLLTHGLIDRLVKSRAQVVNTSSVGARLFGNIDLDDLNTWRAFTPNRAYGNAKLANVLFARGLHERCRQHGLSAVAFHPGMVATNFAADANNYFQRVYHGALSRFLFSPELGGARLRHFIEGRPGVAWNSGEYYGSPTRVGRTHRQAHDPALVDRHWERSAEMLEIAW